jgi:thiamine biosynthesis protein ThiS
MRVTVNGEVKELPPGASLIQALARLGVDPRKVAVERNALIVAKSTYATIMLEDGDRLEIVQFVGGG